MLKTCIRCKSDKQISEFKKDNRRKDGAASVCKECAKSAQAIWAAENPEKIRIKNSKWRADNPERVDASMDKWLARNCDAERERKAQWQTDNPEKMRIAVANWRKTNPDKYAGQMARANKVRVSTPKGKLEHTIRRGILRGIKPGSKAGRKTFDLLGYSSCELVKHIESQFLEGMTWNNHGKVWHIDHEVPLSAFNYETPDHIDFKRAWSLGNLRPMWAKDNLSKGARLSYPFQPSLPLAA